MRQLALFHAEQAAEKYLKALLIRQGIPPPKTHALGTLLELCIPFAPKVESLRDAADALAPYGVEPRYVLLPREVDNPTIKEALAYARSFRRIARRRA